MSVWDNNIPKEFDGQLVLLSSIFISNASEPTNEKKITQRDKRLDYNNDKGYVSPELFLSSPMNVGAKNIERNHIWNSHRHLGRDTESFSPYHFAYFRERNESLATNLFGERWQCHSGRFFAVNVLALHFIFEMMTIWACIIKGNA